MFAFKHLNYFTDYEIDLHLEETVPANPRKHYVPAYKYRITLHSSNDTIGCIDIRISNLPEAQYSYHTSQYELNLYYGGHIGYMIEPAYRGHHYASKACLLIKQVALEHGMSRLRITCNPDNYASRRTCELTGLTLIGIVDVPPENEMYAAGEYQKCIYEWDLME